jgi:hypothetical protein
MLSLFLVALFIFLAARLHDCAFSIDRPHRQWKATLLPVLTLAGCLLAGVIFYLIFSKVNIYFSGLEQSSRTSLAVLDLLPEKLSHLTKDLMRLLHGRGEPSLPANVKLIQLSLLSIILLASALMTRREFQSLHQGISWILFYGLAILAAAISIRIPTIFFAYTADNARVLSGTAVFWSGIFALSSQIRSYKIRQAAVVLGAILFSSYAIITNSICADFVRLNQRELLLASRMVERLAQLPDFNNMRTAVVVGSSPRIYRDLRSSDVLWSGLNFGMGTGVLREASGENIQGPSLADIKLAHRVAQAMPNWPAPRSTAIVNNVGIVVLGKPGEATTLNVAKRKSGVLE